MWGKPVILARIAGIDIRLDASWFLIAALLTWSLAAGFFPRLVPGAGAGPLASAAIVAMLGLFASLILHELSHALVARAHGMRVRTITLFLFGGVAELAEEPPTARAEFRVAIAGPIASFAISGVAGLATRVAFAAGAPDLVTAILSYLAWANLILAVFNLLPAFPLDGGRMLRAILWRRSQDLLAATRTATRISTLIAYGIIGLGGLQILSGFGAGGLWPVLLGLFILAAAHAANARMQVTDALSGLAVADVMRRDPLAVTPDMTLQQVVEDVMLAHALSYAPVVEDDVVLGEIDLATIREIDRDLWPNTRVDDVFRAVDPSDFVPSDLNAAELFDRIIRNGRRKYPVVSNGRLRGLVTLSDLIARVRMTTALASPQP